MFYIVKQPNGSVGIDQRGNIVFGGGSTHFDDLVVPLTTTRRGSNTKPDFDETNVGYLFPQNDTDEILYFIVQLPHSYKVGSDIYPHVHWRQAAAQNVTFKMDYKWFNIGDAVPAGFTTITLATPVVTYSSGSIHQISKSTAAISGTGKGISSILLCKLYRDDNVYTGDALTFQMDFHVEKDTLGSADEFVK